MDAERTRSDKALLFNLPIDVLTSRGFLDEFRRRLSAGEQASVFFLNAHCFNVAQQNERYREALRDSTFLLNDGIGVAVAGRLSGIRFPENLNGTDLIPRLVALFAELDMSVFLLGARPAVIERTASVLSRDYPGLRIAGFRDGYFTSSADVVQEINASNADALIVGMGVPKQELWIAEHGAALANTRALVAGGAIFDFVSGEFTRAPAGLRRMHLEWCYRLAQEPRRLFSRYVLGGFVFAWNILVKRY